MALLPLVQENPTKLPKDLTARLERGRERLRMIATERDVAWEFYRGNHNAYTDEKNKIAFEPTVTTVRGQGKPRWKSAQKRNLIFDAVLYESSAATQRVPGYQVVPSTEDPDDRSAAQLAEKVALYGHGKWNFRKVASDAVIHAIVGGEAFAWPFFDNTIGPYIETGEVDEGGNPAFVGEGDVKVRVFGSNECYWEPGLRFEDSPWHAVEQARTAESVEQMQGYMLKPGSLTPDADTRQLSNQGRTHQGERKLVVVTDYLERPSPAKPDGNWVTLANGRRIVPDRPYPCEGADPVLQKLSYAPDPDSDRDFGLVPQLLDAQRTHNSANNRIVEWSALCLLPRIVVTPGLMKKQRWTSEPGKVYEVPQPDQNFKVVDTPTVPRELFELTERAEHDIGRLSAQNDIPTQVESGRGIQALLEKDSARRAAFTAALADWYSRLMHDCLYLVQKHYTEDRTLHIKGGFGWESIRDFQGASLKDQIDVRVFPDSIEPRTRQAVEQRMMNYAQLGWVGPDQAMSAIESGTAEALMSSLMRDEARAHRIIQRVKQGPDALAAMPMIPTGRTAKVEDPNGQIDPMTGQPLQIDTGKPEMAPAWMPRYADNLKVFRDVIEDWIATEEFENLAPELQEAAAEIYMGVIMLEAEKAQEQAMAQNAAAEQLGMDNAASGGKPKPNPSFPALDQQEQAQT